MTRAGNALATLGQRWHTAVYLAVLDIRIGQVDLRFTLAFIACMNRPRPWSAARVRSLATCRIEHMLFQSQAEVGLVPAWAAELLMKVQIYLLFNRIMSGGIKHFG